MIDNLTSQEVRTSVARHRLTNAERIEALAQCARKEVLHGSYAAAVKAGEIEPWERAFALVVSTQDVLRALAGRTRDGTLVVGVIDRSEPPAPWLRGEPLEPTTRCAYVPPKGPDPSAGRDEREAYRQALEAEELGYVHDPGWRNGGVSSYGAELMTDEERKTKNLKPSANLRGLQAFAELAFHDAIPELGWYYSASALELGVSSCFDAMMATLQLGQTMGRSSGEPPSGPSPDQIAAARLQRAIRRRIGQLAIHQQANLETAYTDRTYDARLVARYGEGVAALVWRAARAAGEVTQKGVVEVGPGTLARLIGDVRRDWPTYGMHDGEHREVEERVREAASLVLWTAHARYRIVSGIEPRPPKRRRCRELTLVAAGQKGKKRRQLVQAPRSAA